MVAISKGREGDKPGEARKRALRRALQMLSYRSRSRREIVADLAGRGCSTEIVEEVVSELEEKGLIGDAALAQDIVSGGQRAGKSRSRIYAVLRRRGISRETADEALEAHFDLDEECEAATREIRKMLPITSGPPGAEDLERAARRLSSRGFSAPAVARALKETASGAEAPGGFSFP